jgi:hypothetical protein
MGYAVISLMYTKLSPAHQPSHHPSSHSSGVNSWRYFEQHCGFFISFYFCNEKAISESLGYFSAEEKWQYQKVKMGDISTGGSDVDFSPKLKKIIIITIHHPPQAFSLWFSLYVCVKAPKCVMLCHILCVCF